MKMILNPEAGAGNRYSLPGLLRASRFRLGAIAMVAAALVGSFARTAGWLSPGRRGPHRQYLLNL
jgi:hypothetical protein